MQITLFIVGGSIAILHSFVWIVDTSHVISPDNLKWVSCISTPDQALPILINVLYLLPLTALFTAFYIESYLKKNLHKGGEGGNILPKRKIFKG